MVKCSPVRPAAPNERQLKNTAYSIFNLNNTITALIGAWLFVIICLLVT